MNEASTLWWSVDTLADPVPTVAVAVALVMLHVGMKSVSSITSGFIAKWPANMHSCCDVTLLGLKTLPHIVHGEAMYAESMLG